MSLKDNLLELKIFEDNKYLDKYIELIESNRDTKREKFKTQRHHIIPKSYYKLNKMLIDNSQNNIVNLFYKDHILAHYYLCMCIKADSSMRYNSLLAFQYLYSAQYTKIPNTDEFKNLELFIIDDNITQGLYEELARLRSIKLKNLKKGKPLKITPEQRKKGAEIRKKKYESGELIPWNKGKKGSQHSEEWKKQASDRMKGRIIMHKGDTEIKARGEDVDTLLKDGYSLGISEKHHEKITAVNRAEAKRKSSSAKLVNHPVSKESIEKMRMKLIGRRYKQKCATKIWVNNGTTEIKIAQKEKEIFLKNNPNYKTGRITKPFKRKENLW